MKKVLFVSVLLFLLSSCGTETPENNQDNISKQKIEKSWQEWKNKNNFNIDIKTLWDFSNQISLQKVWKIVSGQSIDISSQVSWKLQHLYVKEGENVDVWQPIAILKDEYSKYALDLKKAKIDYEKQVINKESQILWLDKKIADTKSNFEDAKQNLKIAEITITQDKNKAELDIQNADQVDSSSQAYLELEKAKLDYQNTLDNNTQQLQTYVENVKKEYNNLSLALGDVIKFSDEILGVTQENKDKNDDFDNFLGAKDTTSKSKTKTQLLDLIEYRENLQDIDTSTISPENIIETMDDFYSGYDKIKLLLQGMENIMNNSIASVGALSDSDINTYVSKINSFQSSNQNNLSSFTSTKNAIDSFLATYKNKELSALKNVELQEKKSGDSSIISQSNYTKTIATLDNNLYSYQSKAKQAELAYNNAVDNKIISLKSLDNIIESASNNVQKSSAEYAKLTLYAPISWVVGNISASVGEQIWSNSVLMNIVWNNNTQIEVALSSNEIKQVALGEKVTIEYQGNIISGIVYSKSSVANKNLEYKVIIHLSEKIDLLWWATVVYFLKQTDIVQLPLSIITIEQDNKGILYHYADNTAQILELELGKINDTNIEIISEIPSDILIITTNLKKFNPSTQTLFVNQGNTLWNQ